MEGDKKIHDIIFRNMGHIILIKIDADTTVEELIHLYFKRMEKENLFTNNIENTYFLYNGKTIDYENNKEKAILFFNKKVPDISVSRLYYKGKSQDISIKKIIKDNLYSCVYEAEYGREEKKLVAIKKIKKKILIEEIKENLCTDEITEEDFKKEIIKFNRELSNMQKCYCENSVEIYDYFDTENEYIIIMELCDNNLFSELVKTKNGFNEKEIKEILLQLNNVFKIMNENNIAHRDIKLNNILIKYLNEKHTKYKVLLSDYGVSNQLNSMTGRYKTYTGAHIIMAPEILEGEEYNNKCDLWSLGVIIYQLYTKKIPYSGQFDKIILNQIKKLGQSVLDVIKDKTLKDLLSKLLVKEPEKRISWKEYFDHDFFK